jgi:hypothetical protein
VPDPLCFSPLVANLAFASELYLKCLIIIETKQQAIMQRDLRKLFSMLPQKTREEIEKRCDAILTKPPQYDLSNAPDHAKEAEAQRPKNFRDALKAGKDAFKDWRYMYEGDAAPPFALLIFPDILRAIILERHPEWGFFQLRMQKIAGVPPTFQAQKTQEPTAAPPPPPVEDNLG